LEEQSIRPIIEIKNLNKTFQIRGGEFTALRDVNLTINEGEIFGIIGLSGAGKSTLVRCINFLEKPTEGTVTVDGKTLNELSPKDLLLARRNMSMIFQNFNLLAQRTALSNVCFPLEIAGVKHADAVKRAAELLDIVDLGSKAKSYPAQLSGGQKQRVAIARALASNPKILLCDEATSALDPTTTASILELLKSINRKLGVTIIVITHEMRVIEQICDRVAVIDHSCIQEIGRVQDVFIHPQSDIAKKLVLPAAGEVHQTMSGKCLRLIFDGMSSEEPVLSNLTLECRAAVNILYAHTKIIDGKVMGQMLLQLPDDKSACARIRAFLDERHMSYSEEDVQHD